MINTPGNSADIQLVVRDYQLDEEGMHNLVRLIEVLDRIERNLTPEQRIEIFGSDNWCSELKKKSDQG